MSVTCSICLVSSTGKDDDSDHFCCIPCGHVFHGNCIDQWLKTKRACPECRHCCNQSHVLRLFLKHDGMEISISEEPENEESSELVRKYRNKVHLQQQEVDELRLKLSEKEKLFDESQKHIQELDRIIKDFKAEAKASKNRQSLLDLKLKEMSELKDRCKKLQERNSMLSRIKTCVEGNYVDVQQLLVDIQSERDTSQGRETLMACLESLKKEMTALVTKNSELLQKIAETNSHAQKQKTALDKVVIHYRKFRSESLEQITTLQAKLQDSEESSKALSNKLTTLEQILADKPDLPQTQIKRYIHESPAPEGLFGTVLGLEVPLLQSPTVPEISQSKKLKLNDFRTPENFSAVQAKEDQPLNVGKRALQKQEEKNKRSTRVNKSIFGPLSGDSPKLSSPETPHTPFMWRKAQKNPLKKLASKKSVLSLGFESADVIELDP